MVGVLLLYILFLAIVITQVAIVTLLLSKLKSIEILINMMSMEMKGFKYLGNMEETKPKLDNEKSKPRLDMEETKPKLDNNINDQDKEEILFVKEVKLDSGSNVVNMGVEINNRKK